MQLVEQVEDLEWITTEEGPKVRLKSTCYVVLARLLEVREYVNGKRHKRALAQYTARRLQESSPSSGVPVAEV
eukprot:10354746-Alexandrium_andersonii.AAC.1